MHIVHFSCHLHNEFAVSTVLVAQHYVKMPACAFLPNHNTQVNSPGMTP
jgi:hypothetical protein